MTATAIPDVPPAYLLSVDQEQVLANCQNECTRHGLLEMLASQKGVFTRGPGGSARYCVLCHFLKPDRCHRCSTCRRCIIKMDHHCPWFNNCVCFSTYKFFLLTLFYTVALCLYGLATLTAHLVEWWSDAWLRKPYAFHVGFLLVVGTVLAVALGSFLVMHLFMVSKNETTLERLRDATFQKFGDSFDLGNRYENFVEVFGPRKITLDDSSIHECWLDEVLQCLTNADLQLNLQKCRFGASQLTILGHVVSKDGILPDATNLQAVAEFLNPHL
ncbi:palmitoyltransferase ZDHHC2-like [Rhipicephalus microplus]|uniref:palmitoyltransferase ZDHHC2-like n=1 Tax=Rhipicephalus microplus TaxID=6941 RepID=UPI003F6C361C